MYKTDLHQEQQISYTSAEKDVHQQTAMSQQGESQVLQTYHVQLPQEQVEAACSQEQQTSVAVPVHLQTYYLSRPELAIAQHQPLDQVQVQQIIQQYKYQEQQIRQQLIIQPEQQQTLLQVKQVQQQQQHVGVQHNKQPVQQKHHSHFPQLQQKLHHHPQQHHQMQQKHVLQSQQCVQHKSGQELRQLQVQQHKVNADMLQIEVQQSSEQQKLHIDIQSPSHQQQKMQQPVQQQQQQKMQVVVLKHKQQSEPDVDQHQPNLRVQHVLLQQPHQQSAFPHLQIPTASEQGMQTSSAKYSTNADDVAKKVADTVSQGTSNWAVQSNIGKHQMAKNVEHAVQTIKHVENGVTQGQQHRILVSQMQQVSDERESKQVSQQMMISQVADKIVNLGDGRMVFLSELQKQQSNCRSTTVINGVRKEQSGVITVARGQQSSRQTQSTIIYSQQQSQQQQQVIKVHATQESVHSHPIQQPQAEESLHTLSNQQQCESTMYCQSPVKKYVVKHPTKNMLLLRNTLHVGTGASPGAESVSQNFAAAQSCRGTLPVAVVQPVQLVSREQEMKNKQRASHSRTSQQSLLHEQHMTMEVEDSNIVLEQGKQHKVQHQKQTQFHGHQQHKLQLQLQDQQQHKLQLQLQDQMQHKLQLQLQEQQQQKLQLQLQDQQQQQKLQLQLQDQEQQQKLQLQLQDQQQQQKLQLQLQEQQQQQKLQLHLQDQQQQQQKLQLQLQDQYQHKLQLQLHEQQKKFQQLQEQQQQKLHHHLQEQQQRLQQEQQQQQQQQQLKEQQQKLLQLQLQEQQEKLQQQQFQEQQEKLQQQQHLQDQHQRKLQQHSHEHQIIHQQFQEQHHQPLQLQQQHLLDPQQNFQLQQQKQHLLQHQKQHQHLLQQHQLQLEKQNQLQQLTQLQQPQLQQQQHLQHQEFEEHQFQHQQLGMQQQQPQQQPQQQQQQQQLQLQLQHHQLQLVPHVPQIQERTHSTEFCHPGPNNQAPQQSLVLLLHGGENEILGQFVVSIDSSAVSTLSGATQVKTVTPTTSVIETPVTGPLESTTTVEMCNSSVVVRSSLPLASDGTEVERIVKDNSVTSIACSVTVSPAVYSVVKVPSVLEAAQVQNKDPDVQKPNAPIARKCCTETQTKESVFVQSTPVDVPVLKNNETENSTSTSKSSTSLAVQQEAELKSPMTEEPRYVAGMLAVCHNCGYLSSDFNKCQRCKKKLPESVKSISITDMLARCKKSNTEVTEKDVQQPVAAAGPVSAPVTAPTTPLKTEQATENPKPVAKQGRPPAKKRKAKVIDEPVILTLSSDEEDSQSKRDRSTSENSSSTKKAEELFVKDRHLCEIKNMVIDTPLGDPGSTSVSLHCRTVRIGSYKAVPKENVFISSSVVRMILPNIQNESKYVTVELTTAHLKGVLMHFGKSMPVLFYYAYCTVGEKIRSVLGMRPNQEPYFNPESDDETHTRITLLPEKLEDDVKRIIWMMYPPSMRGELTIKTANAILVKSSPRELTIEKPSLGSTSNKVKTILIFPPPPVKGGIPISTDDYACLAPDQFLNDVIIDFYLKYLTQSLLRAEDQACTHVFSSFFYKRLTTRPPSVRGRVDPVEDNPSLSPAEKRHCRVKSWTKNVNIFKKRFILIPIVEHMHWFLAVICFPGELGQVRMCDKSPVRKKSTTRKSARKAAKKQETAKQMTSVRENDDANSDRDEADAEDEDIDQNSSEDEDDSMEEPAHPEPGGKPVVNQSPPSQVPASKTGKQKKPVREPIRQPCILIFDSLSGTSRVRVVATLRDYLRVEFKVKEGKDREFSKDTMKGACPKVPQQTNFTDCGLYVLQFAEAFFKDPIKDYHIPIRSLSNWFPEEVVSRKREEICNLLLRLMEENKVDVPNLEIPDFGYRSVQEKLSHLASLQNGSEVTQNAAAVKVQDDTKLLPTDLASLRDVSKMKYYSPSPRTTLLRASSKSAVASKPSPHSSSAFTDSKFKPNQSLSQSQSGTLNSQPDGSTPHQVASQSVGSKSQPFQSKSLSVGLNSRADDSLPPVSSTLSAVSPPQPVTVTQQSVPSSQLPGSSNQSLISVSMPVISVSHLVDSTSQPVVSGSLLVGAVPVSAGETSHLVGSSQLVGAVSQPLIAVPLPVTATPQPVGRLLQTFSTVPQSNCSTSHVVSASRPVVPASQPAGAPPQLAGAPPQLAGAPPEPAGAPPQLAGAPLEPAGAPPEPAGAPPEPAGAPPEPAGAPPEPAGAPPEPAGAPPEPAGAPPEPAGAPPEPAGAPPQLFEIASHPVTPLSQASEVKLLSVNQSTKLVGSLQPVVETAQSEELVTSSSVVNLTSVRVESSSPVEMLPVSASKLPAKKREYFSSEEHFASVEVFHQQKSDSNAPSSSPTKINHDSLHKRFSGSRSPHSAFTDSLSSVNLAVSTAIPVSELQRPDDDVMNSSLVIKRTGKKITSKSHAVSRPSRLPRTRSETRRNNVVATDNLYSPAPSKRARVSKKQ